MSDFNISTQHLDLRSVSLNDFDFIFRTQSDPELMRYIRTAETDPETIRQRMQSWLKYRSENPGLGIWTGTLKGSESPVATGVFRHVEYTPGNEFELGYLVAKECRGQGFATAVTNALSKYAFARFPMDKLVAFTSAENLAGRKVLTKAGFQLVGERFVYEVV